MLQNPQMASMLTPFHHAAAMQAAALHHAAAANQQNNPNAAAQQQADLSMFNSALNSPTNTIGGDGRQSGGANGTGTAASQMGPLGGIRMSPSTCLSAAPHQQKELSHPHGTHLPPPPGNPHHPHPTALPPMGPPPPTSGAHPHIPPGHFLPHPHHNPHLHPHHPHLGLEPPKPRFMFKMPRVVPNQKEKYESDDLMKRHAREGEVGA